MILVDTSVLLGFLKGHKSEATDKFSALLDQDLAYAFPSVCFREVLDGAGPHRDHELLRDFLKSQKFVFPKDMVASHHKAAAILKRCRAAGLAVRRSVSCLVAQIAMENGHPLLHEDQDYHAIANVFPLEFY